MAIALAFLHPLLLWGLPLAAIPIVIHLLNRRRFDTRPWAAMEFLLRAMKRNRRRLQMEQWIVLLLRTLAVLLLILLVARPSVTGGVLGGDATHHICCLDDSASMAHRGGADDSMDRAKEAIERLSTRLANERGGDVFTLMLASDPTQPPLAVVPVGADLPRRVREQLAAILTGDLSLDPAATLAAMADAADAANEVATRAEHYVVTDLRRQDWATAEGTPNPAFVAWLGQIDAERAHLTLVDVGSRDGENIAVTDVRLADRVCVAGVPVRLAVDVRNRGRTNSDPAELAIEIGESRFVRPVPALGPGESTTVEFEQTFRTAGWQGVRAMLPSDRFTVDDGRSLAIDVRPASRSILVDGDPGEEMEESETFFLNVALDNPVTGVEVRLIADHELATLTDDDFTASDMIWLCNVSRFTPEIAARLEAFAKSGGGLAFFLGDQVDIANYNDLLWKQGHGVLPLQLTGVDGDVDDPQHAHIVDESKPLFTQATDQLRLMLGQVVLIGRWITMREDPTAPVDVLLRVRDADGPALMAARAFQDGGAVHVIGTTADALWSDWAVWPVFPILAERLNVTSSRPQDLSAHDLRPDSTFEVEIDPAEHRPDVVVRARGGDGETRTFAAPPSGSERVQVPIRMRDLDGVGLFDVVRHLHAGGDDSTLIARNPLLVEGALSPISSSELTGGLPAEVRDRLTIREGAGSASARDLTGGGLWQLLGLLMLVGMLVESVLAWRFGRR